MTELAKKLEQQVRDGLSIRAIGRKAGMSNSTVRRALAGQELDRSTLEKFAHYFKVPIEEIYRWAGDIPSMYNSEGQLNRTWLLSELWKALGMLTESEQAEVYAHVLRLREREAQRDPEKA